MSKKFVRSWSLCAAAAAAAGLAGCSNETVEVKTECLNVCQFQERVCEGTGYKSCDIIEVDGCLTWSEVFSCGEDEICQEGLCKSKTDGTSGQDTPICEDACTANEKQCDDNNGIIICGDENGDGCTEWSAPSLCGETQTCTNGECLDNETPDSCEDACTEGAKMCDSDGKAKVCGNFNDDPCLEWSAPADCGEHEACNEKTGICEYVCENVCTANEKQCDENNGIIICGDENGDGCTEWSAPSPCGETQTCTNGVCLDNETPVTCEDACTEGAKMCDSDGKPKVCGNFNEDPCLEWSEPAACGDHEACNEKTGICEYVCENTCDTEGKAVCADDKQRAVCQKDAHGCLMMSAPAACGDHEACNPETAACEYVCENTCDTEGQTACTDNKHSAVCKKDAHGCLMMSEPAACGENQICTKSTGTCTELLTQELKDNNYQYATDTTYSPITDETVANMETIAKGNPTANESAFIKIGSRHLAADVSPVLQCFSKAHQNMNLAGYTKLKEVIDAFQDGTFDSYGRESLTTKKTMTISRSISSSSIFSTSYFNPKSPYTQEVEAANPRFALIAIGENDLTAYGKHMYDTSADSSYPYDKGYLGGAMYFFKDLQYLADTLQYSGIIPIFVGLAPRSDQVKTYDADLGDYVILDRDQPKYMVPLWDAVIRAVAGQYKMPYVNVLDSLKTLPNSGLDLTDGLTLSTDSSVSACDFSATGLKYGANMYSLRVMDILRQSYEAYTSKKTTYEGIGLVAYKGEGTLEKPWEITQIPYARIDDTTGAPNKIDKYSSCTVSYSKGGEHVYKMTLDKTRKLRFFALYGKNDPSSTTYSSIDVDIKILNDLTLEAPDEYENVDSLHCGASGDYIVEREMPAGTYYVIVDSSYKSEGEYLFGVVECDPADTSCGTKPYEAK